MQGMNFAKLGNMLEYQCFTEGGKVLQASQDMKDFKVFLSY